MFSAKIESGFVDSRGPVHGHQCQFRPARQQTAQGFVAAVDYVANYFDNLFTNPVTINIHVGFGEIKGSPLGAGTLGESQTGGNLQESYSSLRSALQAECAPGLSALPATSTLSGNLLVSPPEAQALGLNSAISTSYVGFSSTTPWSYAANSRPPRGKYYFIGVVEHEFTEDMGRVSLLDR